MINRPQSFVSELLRDELEEIESIAACPCCGKHQFFPMRVENTSLVMMCCGCCGHAEAAPNPPGPAKEHWWGAFWSKRYIGVDNKCLA